MKLILCDNCGDIFNLTFRRKECSCGKGFGNYLEDGITVEISKSSIPLGFANSSIKEALAKRIFLMENSSSEFTAFVISDRAESIRVLQ